jgi:CRP/FNR family transcriptional regulator
METISPQASVPHPPIRPSEANANACARCIHLSLCQGTAAPGQTAGQRIRVERHASLYRAGDTVGKRIYSIRSGSFKLLRAAPHGATQTTPQVIGFALPPEFLALNALGEAQHACSAVALEDSEVCCISWDRQAFKGRRQALTRPGLHLLLAREIRREQHIAAMLRNTHADQRLADMLLALSAHHAANGYSATRFRLPMSRCDIASYLGVTAECVSRLIVQFKRRELFQLRLRDVSQLDVEALRRMVAGQAPAAAAPAAETGN